MHTVQLLLKTSKYERHEIERRFRALAHLHNVCVKHARKCMIRLRHDKRYAELKQLYNELVKKEKMSKEEKSQKKKLAKQLAACRIEQGLSKASLERYLKVCGKHFGKSINRRAPARFLFELKRKAEAVGGVYAEVDTKEFKASQYNHVTDTYEKIPLSQREKEIGNRKVQRDLYSAFLIRNADLDFKHPDREKCEYEFEYFADMQDQLILKMKESGLSMRQCFGF